MQAEFFIKETINKYNSAKTPVYICSLDAEKAFDTCNWLKLFKALYNRQVVPNVVLKFVIKSYLQGEAPVRYKNTFSDKFMFSQGVRQRSILSPFLYNHYTEKLIESIQSMNVGTKIVGNINTPIVTFADDIIILSSPNLKQLQMMLDACAEHGKQLGIKFNKTKIQFASKRDKREILLLLLY